jgi:hypothetical protein
MESEDLIAKLSGHRRTFVVYSSTQDARYPNNAYAAAAAMGMLLGADNMGGSYIDRMFKPIAAVALY